MQSSTGTLAYILSPFIHCLHKICRLSHLIQWLTVTDRALDYHAEHSDDPAKIGYFNPARVISVASSLLNYVHTSSSIALLCLTSVI